MRDPKRLLTTRELEVYALLKQGNTRRMIAERLCLSEDAVRGAVQQIRIKLDVPRDQTLEQFLQK